jgi:hypothetical protein
MDFRNSQLSSNIDEIDRILKIELFTFHITAIPKPKGFK